MDLIDHEHSISMSREEAADFLRKVADNLSKHNEVRFSKDGQEMSVAVPDKVDVGVEVEIGSDGNSYEVEINW